VPDEYPILQFDPTREAIIEPSRLIEATDIPSRCVACFFGDVFKEAVAEHSSRELKPIRSEMGHHPVHEIAWQGRRLALFQPGVGAPLAGAMLEEMIARGCRMFVACGSCGVLDGELTCGHAIVPSAAVRDEGTSYHYLPPGQAAHASPDAVAAIRATLDAHGCPYVTGTTWTTDGFYRETRARVQRRKEQGCLCVEMEAAALFAVAQFRGVTLGQILYAGDDVSGHEWDNRQWSEKLDVRRALFGFAAEACLRL